jgi:DNA (cytosine-5)-methyltransferase 1
MAKKIQFIDVFSGCGGLSYGLELAGLECLAAIDFNALAIDTFNLNHAKLVGMKQDLIKFEPEDLQKIIGQKKVDLIVGGPPCQGFSSARKSGGANLGTRLIEDPRRDLYKRFLKFVEVFDVKIFIMENVLGIKSAASGVYFTKIQEKSRELGYSVAPIEINCWEYGVPQKRIRQLIIGTRIGLPLFIPSKYIIKTHFLPNENVSHSSLMPIVTLGEAISDLPSLKAGSGSIVSKYDLNLRKKHIREYGERYVVQEMLANSAAKLTWHIARPHSERDLRDFLLLKEGENSKNAIARGVKMETPYSMESFGDKYKRQSRYKLCSTIVAHLRKDGLSFIHPTQNRSLTPREAARIQSFPDTFNFAGQRGNVYQQIGNAVPPLIGRAIGFGVISYMKNSKKNQPRAAVTELSRKKAIKQLESLIHNPFYTGMIEQMPKNEFIKTWNLVYLIHPTLHPQSAFDTAGEKKMPSHGTSLVLEPYYKRTGWPLELIPLAQEAYKRLENKELSELDYFFNNIEHA